VAQLDILAQLQHVDVQFYLPDDILVKVDKASMLNSLETRAPLLDQHLAEYVASLNPSLRIREGKLKYLLKQVAKDLLPAEILARPKQGFSVPIQHWFRDDLTGYASELLDSPQARQRGIFNPQFIRKLLEDHARTSQVNHSSAIWMLLCLELWFQTYMDTPTTPVEPTATYIASK
jgi:asparagine synthase (glutamine-hydrolysing)